MYIFGGHKVVSWHDCGEYVPQFAIVRHKEDKRYHLVKFDTYTGEGKSLVDSSMLAEIRYVLKAEIADEKKAIA